MLSAPSAGQHRSRSRIVVREMLSIIAPRMIWNVFGAGLVGTFLGAAGGATGVIRRTPVTEPARVLLPSGALRTWMPAPVTLAHKAPLLVACRAHQTPWAALSPTQTLVAQNGLGQPLPVVVCFMAIARAADGMLAAVGGRARVVLATPSSGWLPVLAAWSAAGIEVEIVDDIRPWQWEKTILNATLGPLCLATGKSLVEVWADPTWRALACAASAEGERLAAAAGAPLAPGFNARMSEFFTAISAHQPSVLRDAGELPWIFPPLFAVAEQHALATPALTQIAALASTEVTP